MEINSHKYWLEQWNNKHIELCKIPNGNRNSDMADWLEELLARAKLKYYTSGITIMTDYTYDTFENDLRTLRPTSDFFNKVGYKLKD